MGNANQKTTIDTHTKKKNLPKYNTNMVIKPQEKKKGREGKRPTKTNPKQLRKWQ